jgi:hypothetical protein
MNYVYPIRQSRCSCTSIRIHACTTFSIDGGAFSPTFFMSVRRQAKAVPIALPTRSVNNSLPPFSSNRERQLRISPYRHVVVVALIFLDTCDTIKIDSFLCYCEFLDMYVPDVHFTSRTSQHQQSDTSQTNKHINKKKRMIDFNVCLKGHTHARARAYS